MVGTNGCLDPDTVSSGFLLLVDSQTGKFFQKLLDLCSKIPAWMLGGICPPRNCQAGLRQHNPRMICQVVGLITASVKCCNVGGVK